MLFQGCHIIETRTKERKIQPKAVTQPLPGLAEECGIWTSVSSPHKTLLICNDTSSDGGLYAFDIEGKEVSRSERLQKPVGISLRYGIQMQNGEKIDVVGCGIRDACTIKLFSIDPNTRKLIDRTRGVGIPTGFDTPLYGFCLYKRKRDGQLFAFVTAKGRYPIHQIQLESDEVGMFTGTLVRKFGLNQIKSSIEGMVADDEYGYYYAADEQYAILKFYANPAIKRDPFIRAFGVKDRIEGARKGMGIYRKPNGKGYLIVSSRGDSTFKIYERRKQNTFIKSIHLPTVSKTDGIGVTAIRVFPEYPSGIFAAHNEKENNYLLFDWFEFSRLQ